MATSKRPPRRFRFPIFRKGLLIIVVPLAFQASAIAFVSRVNEEAKVAAGLSDRTDQTISCAQDALRHLLEVQSSVRGFLLTGSDAFLGLFHENRESLPGDLEALRARLSGQPDLLDRVDRIEELVQGYLAISEENERLVRDGRSEEAVGRVASEGGKRVVDEVRREVDAIIASETELGALRQRELEGSFRRLDLALHSGAGASLAIAFAALYFFARDVSRRLGVLARNAERVAEGRPLEGRVGGSDEITDLDEAFHHMSTLLEEAAAREQRWRDELQVRNVELSRANEELGRKSRENEAFVYSVSHDLRSPLVNLKGFSRELSLASSDLREVLEGEGVSPDSRRRGWKVLEAGVGESIAFIQTAVTRLSAIIDALLRLSRAGRVEYRRERVEVDEVVERVLRSLESTISEKGARVTVGALPPALADAAAVDRIFANLLANALAYLDPSRRGEIEVGSFPGVEDGRRVFLVRDNGLGIPAEQLPRLFLPFQRLHPQAARGEGIGLALVRSVVERLGGRIWAESSPGEGSVFFVALPATEEGPAPREGAAVKEVTHDGADHHRPRRG